MAESARGQYEANPFFDRPLPERARRAHLDGAFGLVPFFGYLLNPLLTKPGTHNPE